MAQLIFWDEQNRVEKRFPIQKKILNVGTEKKHDIQVYSSDKGVLFTLVQQNASVQLIPGTFRLEVNGLRG